MWESMRALIHKIGCGFFSGGKVIHLETEAEREVCPLIVQIFYP
jgi:hypothetical protein